MFSGKKFLMPKLKILKNTHIASGGENALQKIWISLGDISCLRQIICSLKWLAQSNLQPSHVIFLQKYIFLFKSSVSNSKAKRIHKEISLQTFLRIEPLYLL
jgi:hypothetical protein